MTRQQVFSLYLANPNQRVENRHGEIALDYRFMLSNLYNSPDSKLILKRIADMQYEDWVEMAGFVFDLKLVNETAITMRDLLCNGDGAMLSFKSIVKINEWLITHGYCLDEQWIENGWVTCQK